LILIGEEGDWSLAVGLWLLVFGVWVLDFGLWELVFGLWVLVFGYWKLKRRISNRSGLAKDGVSCSLNPDALGWLIIFRGALRISPALADIQITADKVPKKN
jgi:hypothetical protein